MPENLLSSSSLDNSITVTTVITDEKPTRQQKFPSIDELRRVIPESCFEKPLKKSFSYFLFDIAVLGTLYFAVPHVEAHAGWTGLMAWYWCMGIFLSSLFCIGHDCGHGTFSEYRWVNDFVGHLAHGFLMVPYWPWQKSHRHHHQYTANLIKDKGHPWTTEKEYEERHWLINHFTKNPISGFIRWNPLYTLVGLPDGSHIWPFSKLFSNNRERFQCVVSASVCILFTMSMLRLCNYSPLLFIKYYYIPLLFQGIWIIMITYLQHQDEEIEVFEENDWNFVRGQLQTIDRTYGFGLDYFLHHITDGHVAHHFFFTKIPHYNLPEATRAIRNVLDKYPGTYKRQSCYTHVFEFLRLNVKLDCLTGKGVLRYRSSAKKNE